METTLKETTYFRILIVSLIIALIILYIQIQKVINFKIPDFAGEVAPSEVKDAMVKMGPNYNYMMKGEKLYVDKGDGKWLRLRYERR